MALESSYLCIVHDGLFQPDTSADHLAPAESNAWSKRLASILNHLPDPNQAKLIYHDIATLVDGSAKLPETGIVWFVLDQHDSSDLFEAVGQVQDQHLPALLTMHSDERQVGELYLDGVTCCPPTASDEVIYAMLQTLASQTSVVRALKNEAKVLRVQQFGLSSQIGKIDEEMRIAAKLQREYLPDNLDFVGPASFQAMWLPANYVGGDIYDVMQLDDEHIGIFIADAVGHGVSAALMTMYIKRSLPTRHPDPKRPGQWQIVPPGQALYSLNEDMVAQQAGQVRFATACYAVLNTKTLALTVSRAGHPYPFIMRADGTNETVEPEGGLLGVFDDHEFDETTVQLEPGDRLLFYSDGFEVAFPEVDSETGNSDKVIRNAYEERLWMMRDGTPEEAMQALNSDVENAAGSLNQQDDLTLIMMQIAKDAVAQPQTQAA